MIHNDWFENYALIVPIYTAMKVNYFLPSCKPRVEKQIRSNIIYEIRCLKCGSNHSGMTLCYQQKRIKEHFNSNGNWKRNEDECESTCSLRSWAALFFGFIQRKNFYSITSCIRIIHFHNFSFEWWKWRCSKNFKSKLNHHLDFFLFITLKSNAFDNFWNLLLISFRASKLRISFEALFTTTSPTTTMSKGFVKS